MKAKAGGTTTKLGVARSESQAQGQPEEGREKITEGRRRKTRPDSQRSKLRAVS